MRIGVAAQMRSGFGVGGDMGFIEIDRERTVGVGVGGVGESSWVDGVGSVITEVGLVDAMSVEGGAVVGWGMIGAGGIGIGRDDVDKGARMIEVRQMVEVGRRGVGRVRGE